MALTSTHPLYAVFAPDWKTLRDTHAGERQIKYEGERYLSATSGMVLDGMGIGALGRQRYDAYKSRAVFHDFVKEGVEYYIGLLHQKPPSINLPPKMEAMLEDCTIDHMSAEELLRKINEQQLLTGRYGLLLDIPTNPVVTDERPLLPYIAGYNAEAITNWDVGNRAELDVPELSMVILNETGQQRVPNSFDWAMVQAYRVLVLEGDLEGAKAVYKQALFSGPNLNYLPERLEPPNIRGVTLNRIPFVFANAQDNLPAPDLPPLLGLANLSLAIYRGEADYRQNLFMQGQDTLVVIGGGEKDDYRTGVGSVINLRAGQGVDAKFVGVSGLGLSEQREALENDKMSARNKTGALFDTRSKAKESGEALNTRAGAQAATLNAVALSGAAALEAMFEHAARWLGLDPNDVEVTPNTEWTEEAFLPADLQALMTAKKLGAPISLETIHDIMMDRGMTELDFETEMDKIAEEAPEIVGTDAGGNAVDAKGQSLDPITGEVITAPFKKPVSPNNDPEAKPKGKAPLSKGAAAAKKKKAK